MAEQDPQQEKCKFPNCESGKSMEKISDMVDNLAVEYGRLINVTETQSGKLDRVTKNQEDQMDLWKQFFADTKLIAAVSVSLNNLTTAFNEFRADTKKANDDFGKNIREKVSRTELKTYAVIVVTVCGGVFAFLTWLKP